MVRGIEGRRSEALGAAVVERARQGFGWVERATGERRASEPELRNVAGTEAWRRRDDQGPPQGLGQACASHCRAA